MEKNACGQFRKRNDAHRCKIWLEIYPVEPLQAKVLVSWYVYDQHGTLIDRGVLKVKFPSGNSTAVNLNHNPRWSSCGWDR